MKQLFKTFALIVVGLILVQSAWCRSSKKSKSNSDLSLKLKEVNFHGDKSGDLTISNNSAGDIIIFCGSVKKDKILGGLHASSTALFDLSKIPNIPRKGSVLIRAVSFETYKKKIFISDDDAVYSQLLVYDFDSNEKYQISIFSGVDLNQETAIYVSNYSRNFVIELMKDSVSQGEIIATIEPGRRNKPIFIQPDVSGQPINLFPAFVTINKLTGERIKYPCCDDDGESVFPRSITSEKVQEFSWEEPTSPKLAYKCAFINLKNDSAKTIQLRDAKAVLRNVNGLLGSMSGDNDIYHLEVKNGEEQLYTNLNCRISPTKRTIDIPQCKLQDGFEYDLTISKDFQILLKERGPKKIEQEENLDLIFE